MQFIKFFYQKKEAPKPELYEVLVLERDSEAIKGIAFSKLNEEERKELLDATKAYEKVLKKYFSSFRRFNTSSIVNEVKNSKTALEYLAEDAKG